MNRTLIALAALLAAALGPAVPARAEVSEIRLANQYGFGHLQLTLIKGEKLIEKHAAAAGITLKPVWFNTQGSAAMADALLSGSADVISTGVTGFLNIWDKTKGTAKAIGPVSGTDTVLVSVDPAVKTVADFTDAHRIAVPAVKVSPQAILLQMAAAKAFGEAQYDRLDRLTVALSHPDGLAALRSGVVSAHFAPPPFYQENLKLPGAHVVLRQRDVLGSDAATAAVLVTTQAFHDANPKVYGVLFAALKESLAISHDDPRRTADIYLRETGDKIPRAEVEALLTEIREGYELVPRNTLAFTEFMARTGSIKRTPASWKDLFFPEIHDQPGS